MTTALQDYLDVTELSGDLVSQEQVDRIEARYVWAANGYCKGKAVVELACGTGQGLGLLSEVSSTLEASDYSEAMVSRVKEHYGTRVDVRCFDAASMPFEDNSKDVLIIFEAIYYLPDIEKFFHECQRVLKTGGYLLIASANKDLYDFNPSPYSHIYLGVMEMADQLQSLGFDVEFFASHRVDSVSLLQQILRPIKKIAVMFNLVPKSMNAKRILKRLVFGKLIQMPAEISNNPNCTTPEKISKSDANNSHKVIYCAAKLA